jgi:hypothetical protein
MAFNAWFTESIGSRIFFDSTKNSMGYDQKIKLFFSDCG